MGVISRDDTRPADSVTHAAPVVVRARAHARASYAASRTPARILAHHFGVSESRVRHQRSDDASGPLTLLLGMIADPAVEGGPLVAAVLSAYEERFLFASTDDLRARLAHLKNDKEHGLEARQNRALQLNSADRCSALRDHAAALLEIATIEEVLGA